LEIAQLITTRFKRPTLGAGIGEKKFLPKEILARRSKNPSAIAPSLRYLDEVVVICHSATHESAPVIHYRPLILSLAREKNSPRIVTGVSGIYAAAKWLIGND
jgi:hypothetical protein